MKDGREEKEKDMRKESRRARRKWGRATAKEDGEGKRAGQCVGTGLKSSESGGPRDRVYKSMIEIDVRSLQADRDILRKCRGGAQTMLQLQD